MNDETFAYRVPFDLIRTSIGDSSGDIITNRDILRTHIEGKAGDDTLTGGARADTIDGGADTTR